MAVCWPLSLVRGGCEAYVYQALPVAMQDQQRQWPHMACATDVCNMASVHFAGKLGQEKEDTREAGH